MKEFHTLLDHLKSLYDSGLFEDVKMLADLLNGMIESTATTTTNSYNFDIKDKYTIYYLHGMAAFNLKEYKLAESLFNKALQTNKTNLRSKAKTLNTLVNSTTNKFFVEIHEMNITIFERNPKQTLSSNTICICA